MGKNAFGESHTGHVAQFSSLSSFLPPLSPRKKISALLHFPQALRTAGKEEENGVKKGGNTIEGRSFLSPYRFSTCRCRRLGSPERPRRRTSRGIRGGGGIATPSSPSKAATTTKPSSSLGPLMLSRWRLRLGGRGGGGGRGGRWG